METGNISKTLTHAAPVAPVRAEQLVAAGAVKTQLAPETAVKQADKAPAVRFAPSDGADFRASLDAAMRDAVERNIMVDPKTRQLVYQAISKETGVIVRQVPDEAMLQLRAYLREMRAAEDKKRSDSDVVRVEKIA
jgi:uncharacterized FlaG/YvyC family protein